MIGRRALAVAPPPAAEAPVGGPAALPDGAAPAPRPPRDDGAGRLGGRGAVTLILLGAFAWSLTRVDWGAPLLHANGLDAFGAIAGAALRPNLSPEILTIAAGAAWRTVAYATAGVSLAVALALPAGIVASGALTRGPAGRILVGGGMRAVLGVLRAIHELVWAWLFIAAIGLSPAAAVLALALPYAGILGRILADMLNDVPPRPLASLAAAGAGPAKQMLYGRLPLALPNMVSYALYRWECGLRSAAILSFVGLGGLGYQIQISLDDLRFDEVWTFVYALVLLVVLLDAWSGVIRRRLVA